MKEDTFAYCETTTSNVCIWLLPPHHHDPQHNPWSVAHWRNWNFLLRSAESVVVSRTEMRTVVFDFRFRVSTQVDGVVWGGNVSLVADIGRLQEWSCERSFIYGGQRVSRRTILCTRNHSSIDQDIPVISSLDAVTLLCCIFSQRLASRNHPSDENAFCIFPQICPFLLVEIRIPNYNGTQIMSLLNSVTHFNLCWYFTSGKNATFPFVWDVARKAFPEEDQTDLPMWISLCFWVFTKQVQGTK